MSRYDAAPSTTTTTSWAARLLGVEGDRDGAVVDAVAKLVTLYAETSEVCRAVLLASRSTRCAVTSSAVVSAV
ncbi:hypothetical protein [Mycobacterium sp. AT1]|uniref:hypothetical protein n=1 Tax=Mycobacterium sp. AT1 TaxID=1961706 RepID=UPI0009C5D668|nr:hypothetical protein B1790_03140 [Mycobacterium sp. AT1]